MAAPSFQIGSNNLEKSSATVTCWGRIKQLGCRPARAPRGGGTFAAAAAMLLGMLMLGAGFYGAAKYFVPWEFGATSPHASLYLWWKEVSGMHGKLHGELYTLSIVGPESQTRAKIQSLIKQSATPSNLPEVCMQNHQGRLEHHVECEQAKLKLAALPPPFNSIHNIPNWGMFHELLHEADKQHDEYYTTIMRDLVAAMKGPVDKYFATIGGGPPPAGGPTYASCAVVGNVAATLLNRSYGHFIDTHEAVLRLDFAHTRGYEKIVGQRTTLVVVGEDVLHECAERSKTCTCQLYGTPAPTVAAVLVPEHYMDVAVCKYSPVFPLLVAHVQFNRLCKRIARWYAAKRFALSTGSPLAQGALRRRPVGFSTGLQGVVLALSMCNRVDRFGFQHLASGEPEDLPADTYFPSNPATSGPSKRRAVSPPMLDLGGEFLFYKDLARTSKAYVPQFVAKAGIQLPRVHIYT